MHGRPLRGLDALIAVLTAVAAAPPATIASCLKLKGPKVCVVPPNGLTVLVELPSATACPRRLMNRGAGLALIRAGDQGYAGVDFSDLVPCGFVVESATRDDSGFVIAIRGAVRGRRCPACRWFCSRVRSQYRRRPSDLPAAAFRIALILWTRPFFCDAEACARRIFAERPRCREALGVTPPPSLSKTTALATSASSCTRAVARCTTWRR